MSTSLGSSLSEIVERKLTNLTYIIRYIYVMARSKTPTNYKGKWFYVVDLAEYLEGDVRHFYLGTI